MRASANDGLRRGFVVLTLAQAAFIVSSYATHIVLARALGPAEYGRYNVTLSVLSMVALVLTGGMPEAIAKFAAENPAEARGVFARGIGIQFRFSLLLGLTFAALSPVLGLLLHDSTLTPILATSALAIPPIALYAVVLGAFNGEHRFVAQALTVSAYAVLRAALVIALTWRFQVLGAVVAFVLAPLAVVSFALPGLLRPRSQSSLAARELWLFARPVMGFTIALALLMGLDLFVVKAVLRDADAVGYYSAAATVAKVPYFFFSTLGVVLLPIVSSAGGRNDAAMVTVRRSIRLMFAVSLGVVAVVAPFSRAVMETLYGARYTAAALPLGLLVLAGTLFTLTSIVAYTLNGLGHPGIGMRLTALGLLLEVVLAVTLTPRFGTAGAAGASCVASFVILVAILWYARPLLGVIVPWRSLARVGLAFVATFAVGLLLPHVRPLHLLATAPLALGYLGALLLMREFTIPELATWRRRS